MLCQSIAHMVSGNMATIDALSAQQTPQGEFAGIVQAFYTDQYPQLQQKAAEKNQARGIPSEDQLVPLPTDVIVTERTMLSKNTINEIRPDEIKNIHINYVTILNCDDVINGYHIDEKKDNLGGVNDGKNEFSNLQTSDNNPYIEPAVIRNKWITLNQQPTGYKAFPCQEPPKTWNILGVPSEDIKYTAECPGKRESTEQTDLQGQTWPTLGTVPRRNGDNAWLFKLDRGIPSFPTGRST